MKKTVSGKSAEDARKNTIGKPANPEILSLETTNYKIMTFSELTQTDKPVLVDFYADWCAPCRAMKPILEDVKNRLGQHVAVFKIDVDKNQAIAERFNIMSIPTLMIFKDGKPVWRKSGMASSMELVNAVRSFDNSEQQQ